MKKFLLATAVALTAITGQASATVLKKVWHPITDEVSYEYQVHTSRKHGPASAYIHIKCGGGEVDELYLTLATASQDADFFSDEEWELIEQEQTLMFDMRINYGEVTQVPFKVFLPFSSMTTNDPRAFAEALVNSRDFALGRMEGAYKFNVWPDSYDLFLEMKEACNL